MQKFVLSIALIMLPTLALAESPGPPKPSTTSYVNAPTNSHWEGLKFSSSIYDTPYKISLFNPQNGEDSQRLASQTKSMFAYGLGVAGVLALMPTSVSGWDIGSSEPLKQWVDNVSSGPIWDRDTHDLNYITHPYFGGVYYQSARKSGYRQWDSFFYSFMMSTFYWEYGLEAFAEVPSIQDLVVTPVLGWVYGEWAFNKEQAIRRGGGGVGGSQLLGSTALFFLDPADTIGSWVNGLLGRQLITAGTAYVSYSDSAVGPEFGSQHDKQLTLNIQYTLGMSNEPTYYKRYREISNDPVDTGVVGLSLGAGYIKLDDHWNHDGGSFPEWTLGLYFSPRYSMRLKYGLAELQDKTTGQSVNYENYSLDGQYYFNTQSNTRPYLSVGFGEEMFDKDRRQKNFLVNLGAGLHHKLNSNWAIQADWENFYSPDERTYESSINARIIYRFGRGEEAWSRAEN